MATRTNPGNLHVAVEQWADTPRGEETTHTEFAAPARGGLNVTVQVGARQFLIEAATDGEVSIVLTKTGRDGEYTIFDSNW